MERYIIYITGLGNMPAEYYAPNEKEARAQCEQRLSKFDIKGSIRYIDHVKYTEPKLPRGRCKRINREYKVYAEIFPNREITFMEYLIKKSIKGDYDEEN